MGVFGMLGMSDQLRSVLQNAQRSARRLNQDFVGTEHLILGILECSACEAARALAKAATSGDALKQSLLGALPRGAEMPIVTGDLPLSPKAQRAVNLALANAQSRRAPKVTTRWLLLALLDEFDTAVRQSLRQCGADVDQLQRLLAQPPDDAEK
jgi:ATP-dependent Clp protease ATP-binding subunit ClpC